MEEKVLNLIGKRCFITLSIGDSYTGLVKKVELNELTNELRVTFEIEQDKGLVIPISQIKSISEAK